MPSPVAALCLSVGLGRPASPHRGMDCEGEAHRFTASFDPARCRLLTGHVLGDEGKAAAVTPSAAFAVALRNKWGLRAIRAKGNRESEPRFLDCQRELQRKTRLTTKKMVKSEAHPAYRPWGLTLFPFSSISSFPSSPSSSSSWLFS